MQLRLFPHRRATVAPQRQELITPTPDGPPASPSAPPKERPAQGSPPEAGSAVDSRTEDGPVDSRVFTVHRVGAIAIALIVLVFGILGFADGLPFFSTSGRPVLGMSSNGLLSTISVLTAAVLIAAALRGPRIASTVMITVGTLFLLSALLNLALLRTDYNILAFELSNVGFSVASGFVLLFLGAYGRLSGNLPSDSPYARPAADDATPPEYYPSTPEEFAAERAMRAAEIAVVNHVATADQRRRVAAMAEVRTRLERRQVWMSFGQRA